MEGNRGLKKYSVVDEQLVLFHEEYYLSVLRFSLEKLDTQEMSVLFSLLYEFTSVEMEIEIDVSEEGKSLWYLQLLVPFMLVLPEMAQKRIQRGKEALSQYLQEKQIDMTLETLLGDEVFHYVKRYNPDIEMV